MLSVRPQYQPKLLIYWKTMVCGGGFISNSVPWIHGSLTRLHEIFIARTRAVILVDYIICSLDEALQFPENAR